MPELTVMEPSEPGWASARVFWPLPSWPASPSSSPSSCAPGQVDGRWRRLQHHERNPLLVCVRSKFLSQLFGPPNAEGMAKTLDAATWGDDAATLCSSFMLPEPMAEEDFDASYYCELLES